MIEYDDGDSEELTHKTVAKCIVTANSAIDQLRRLTRSALQAKTATHTTQTRSTMNKRKQYAMPVFDETTEKMLEYRHLINHPDPKVRKQWQISGANEFGRTMQGVGKN
jgi:hypothetical protein